MHSNVITPNIAEIDSPKEFTLDIPVVFILQLNIQVRTTGHIVVDIEQMDMITKDMFA